MRALRVDKSMVRMVAAVEGEGFMELNRFTKQFADVEDACTRPGHCHRPRARPGRKERLCRRATFSTKAQVA